MLFKKLKCVEITKSEYNDIKFINTISHCQAEAVDYVADYLVKDRKVDANLNAYVLRDLAYNLYMAVMNDYKYMKVVD